MTKYLKKDDSIPADITDNVLLIKWILANANSGTIELYTSRKLSSGELDYISDWVSAENSDGLGEGFCQQDFFEDEMGGEDDDYYNDVMPQFDFKTNDYKFRYVGEYDNN